MFGGCAPRKCRMNQPNALSVRSRNPHPCKKRKDGAPSVGMVHAKIVKAGPPAISGAIREHAWDTITGFQRTNGRSSYNGYAWLKPIWRNLRGRDSQKRVLTI